VQTEMKMSLMKNECSTQPNAFRNQHYLPAVYLKQFSVDGIKATRKSRIWRHDKERSVPVAVESQCAQEYFYSSRDPKGIEDMFRKQGENAYGQIAKKIWQREHSKNGDYFGLISLIFDLHCRNIAYENRTRQEHRHAYEVLIECLRDWILRRCPASIDPDQQFVEHIRAVWRVRLSVTAGNGELSTSDNPALLFTLNETNDLHLAIMPVTPFCCAVAFDSRFSKMIEGHLSVVDQSRLNRYQLSHCCDCVFTSNELSAEQQKFIREQWKKRERHSGYVDERECKINLLRLADGEFSFLTSLDERIDVPVDVHELGSLP